MTRAVLLALVLPGLVACRPAPPDRSAQPAPVDRPAAATTVAAPPRALPDPFQQARERGAGFRAVGQEPGWFVEIGRDSMRLVYDYAEREATTPVPAPVRTGTRTVYSAVTEAHRLVVVIDERRCQDGMSGEPFATTVAVTIDGRTLRGCGRWLGSSEPWIAEARKVGPVQVGMTPELAAAALGASLIQPDTSSECRYARASEGPSGVSFMIAGGRIVRADVTAAGVPTDQGIEVGSTEAQVRDAYGASVTSSPHKYTSGRYLTVAPDAVHRIVFETDGTRVTRYRIGQRPEVEWVEGCS